MASDAFRSPELEPKPRSDQWARARKMKGLAYKGAFGSGFTREASEWLIVISEEFDIMRRAFNVSEHAAASTSSSISSTI